MSSTPKGAGSLLHELLRAVTKLSSAVSSGVVGKPINPGPVVDPRQGPGPDPLRRRR
ncbi:hypothetical protein [Sphaerisporangium perillae]|uniref:hypothetical protein n=1 Tax=Sphaerisporangium perillae TaxID=2935860 RepID=UPI0020107795|nr:hypothetical protein [Sphaerisporangium perillae]